MKFGGLLPCTLQDYPGHIAAMVFTVGCNFRCGYCHNPEFITGIKAEDCLEQEHILSFLEQRRGLLQGLVICGGEPTIHPELVQFIKKVKALGFLVKLDTNGTKPEVVELLLREKLIDYIAMDIKYKPEEYELISRKKTDHRALQRSIRLILEGNILYEFRSTILPEYHNPESLKAMARSILGAEHWVLQRFQNSVTLDAQYSHKNEFSLDDMENLKKELAPYVKRISVRG